MKRLLVTCLLVSGLLAGCATHDPAWVPPELYPPPEMPAVAPPLEAVRADQEWYPVDPQTVAVLAGDRSFEVFAGKLANREAWVAADQALRAMWPVLRPAVSFYTLDGEEQGTLGNFVDVDKQALTVGVGVGIALDVVDSRTRLLAARQTALATEQASVAATRMAILEASELFDELVRTQNEIAIAGELLAGARAIAELEQARETQGTGLRADRLRAEAQEAAAESVELQTQATFREVSARLAQMLRIDPRVTLFAPVPEVEPLELIPADAPLEPLLLEAQEQRPEIAAAVLQVGAADEVLRGARLSPWVPSIFAQVNVAGFGQNFTGLEDREEFRIGLAWDLSLENFGRRDVAQVRLAQEKLNLTHQREIIVTGVVRYYELARVSRAAIHSSRRQVEAASEAVLLVEQRHVAGSALVVEVLEAQRQLALARQRLLHTILEHNHAQRRLHFAVGR